MRIRLRVEILKESFLKKFVVLYSVIFIVFLMSYILFVNVCVSFFGMLLIVIIKFMIVKFVRR